MTTTLASWLYVLFGMLLMDTVLCAWFLKKISESLLELTITALIFVIAKLLERNPIQLLDENLFFTGIAAVSVLISLGVMFYHVFIKIIPTTPYHKKSKKHRYNEDQHTQPKPPANNKNRTHR